MKPSVVAQRKNSSASIIPPIKEFDIPRIFSIGFVLLTVQSFPPAFHKKKILKNKVPFLMGFPNKTMFCVNLSWCLSRSNFGIELAGCPTTDVLRLAACLRSMPMLLAVSFVVAVQFPALRSGTLENGQMLAMSIFFRQKLCKSVIFLLFQIFAHFNSLPGILHESFKLLFSLHCFKSK